MSTANLNAKITADAKQFHKQMGRVKGKTKSIGISFGALGGMIGAALSVRALTGFISKLDEIGKHAKQLQITTDEFQRLKFAAERSGTTMATVETAFKKLSKMINDADRGMQSAKDAFSEVGVSMDMLKGKTPTEQFKLVAKALSLMTDKNKKAALSQELLSRGGMQLIPMFKDLNALYTEAETHGIINADTIKAAEELEDSFTNLKTSLSALVAESGVFEAMNEGLKLLTDTIQAMKKAEELNKNLKPTREVIGYKQEYAPGARTSITVPIYKDTAASAPSEKEQKDFAKQHAEKRKIAKESAAKDKAIKDNQAKAAEERAAKAKRIEEKKLSIVRLELAILEAKNTLGEKAFRLKKLELEMNEKIKNAENDKTKAILEQQLILKKTLLQKELGVKVDEVTGSTDTSTGKTSIEHDTGDRIKRIGGMLGGQGPVITRESPSEKKRNDLLIKNNRKLDALIDKTTDGKLG